MKNIRLSIGNRIILGFLVLIILFIINGTVSILTLSRSNNLSLQSSTIIKPSVTAIEKYILLVTQTKMFSTNWVYLQKNVEDKEELVKLFDQSFPVLEKELKLLSHSWQDQDAVTMLDATIDKVDSLQMIINDEIINMLVSFEDYEDPMKKLGTQEVIDAKVLPQTATIINSLEEIRASLKKVESEVEASTTKAYQQLGFIIILFGILTLVIGIISSVWIARAITKPVNYIKNVVLKMSKGELPEDNHYKFNNDEIGEMADAMDNLVNGLKATSQFAESIGTGLYDTEFTPLSDGDVLGNSLLDMRDNLSKVAEDDNRRNWAAEGLAKFGELLRKHNDELSELADQIISNLVDYVKANQGGLYIINEDEEEPYLTLQSCYAWDKKKYLEQKILKGDGLTGQAWLESNTIYITEVPQDYVQISSGLGEANPKSILIVPLKVNEQTYGIVELASFNAFEKYQIEFVEKLAESIASSIAAVRVNERTHKLLEESTELTEQLKAQEEEMRQNMEELQATQEEMQRAQREREAKEHIIQSTTMVIELDDNLAISSTNKNVVETLAYDTDLTGKNIEALLVDPSVLQAMKQALESENKIWSGLVEFICGNEGIVKTVVSLGKITDILTENSKTIIYASVIKVEQTEGEQ